MPTIPKFDIDLIPFTTGSHKPPDGAWCVQEAVAWVAGEDWSDHPSCVSSVIGAFSRSFNDNLDDEGKQKLKRYIPVIRDANGKPILGNDGRPQPDLSDQRCMIGTNTGPEDEQKRAWLIADWMTHIHLPTWLDAGGMTEQAAMVRALPRIVDKATLEASNTAIWPLRQDLWKRRSDKLEVLRVAVRKAVKEAIAKRGAAVADAVAAVAAVDAVDAAAVDVAAVAAVAAAVDAVAAVADAVAVDAAAVAAAADAAAVAAVDAAAAVAAAVDAVAVAAAAVAVAVAAAVDAAAVDAAAVAAVVAAAVDAAAAPYGSTYRAVYNAVKPIYVKAIKEHSTIGPVAVAMQQSGFDLLDALCLIGRGS